MVVMMAVQSYTIADLRQPCFRHYIFHLDLHCYVHEHGPKVLENEDIWCQTVEQRT